MCQLRVIERGGLSYSSRIILCMLCLSTAGTWCCQYPDAYTTADLSQYTTTDGAPTTACGDYHGYYTDTSAVRQSDIPVKYIRVNFHVMQDDDGRHNFDEAAGQLYYRNIISYANDLLGRNNRLFLPYGQPPPLLPTRYRLHLAEHHERPGEPGIYFHRDSELYSTTRRGTGSRFFDKRMFEKYRINPDTELNVFCLVHPPDSVASATYEPAIAGVAYGHEWVKVVGDYYHAYHPVKGSRPPIYWGEWYTQNNHNHEVGHILGLRHSWYRNDGCDDTPPHPNCWNRTDTPPCDTAYSNNIMDYNNFEGGWSPCQIARIQMRLADINHPTRRMLLPTWCEYDSLQSVVVADTVVWGGARDLRGDIHILPGGYLRVECRVSLPPTAVIRVARGGTLHVAGGTLMSDCDGEWQGIQLQRGGNPDVQLVISDGAAIRDYAPPAQLN